MENLELPKWKKSPLSVLRDTSGAFSSKRFGAFYSLGVATYGTIEFFKQLPAMISSESFTEIAVVSGVILGWLALAAALWGVSLGEKK